MKHRRFTPKFKRSIIEQLLSEAAGPSEICRRYHLSSGQLYTCAEASVSEELGAVGPAF